ncbi:MAG: autotransporter-associated beta strand repeat-containing protein [Verrucomicrobiaceae bacterium]|nr:autotransporter-associated beta strand repeat-containing protein [Verrucomicrobiaceae bacterium]
MFALGSIAPFAHADNNWDGGANTLWSNNVNWGADTAPNLAGILNFAGGANVNNNNDLAVNSLIGGLAFGGGAGFTLNGNAIQLGASGITANTNNHTIAFGNITLTAAQTWLMGAGGGLTVNSPVNTAGNLLAIDGPTPTITTINGNISGSAGLAKNGTGRLILAGAASNYTGTTLINNGGITLGSNNGLGASGAGNGTTVASGAFLDLNGFTTNESLTLSGTGGLGGGALGNSAGNGVVTGSVTLAANTQVNANAATSLSITGPITGAFNLTKADTGTLTLNNAANAYSNLIVNAGAVNLLGGGAVPDASNVTLSGGTTLNVNAAETIARVTGPGTVNLNTLLTIGAAGTGFTLDSTLNGANGITYSKAGQTIIVSGNNGYQGATNVTAGTVQLANNNALGNFAGSTTTVANNAILDLNGQSITENLDITGAGSGAGVLINTNAAASQVTGTVNLSGNSVVGTSNGAITLNGAVTGGASTFTKVGTGTVNFTGGAAANTYTGLTTVNDGTLGLGKNASVNAIAGNLNIGDTVGAANSATVQLNAADQIINSSNVIIAADGRLNRNGNNETINNLTITSGSVTGAGTLTITDLNMTAGQLGTVVGAGSTVLTGNAVATNAAAVPAVINDNLTLGGAAGSRTITVNPSAGIAVGNAVAASPHLNITGVISSGVNNNGFTKEGTGTLQINNANTYVGQTVINNGIVLVGNNNAAGTPFGSNAGNTVVNPNGTILLQNGAFTGAEPITITGAGFNPGTGALGNIAVVAGGNATVNGPVTVVPAVVGGSSFITAGQGNTLNFTGGINKTGTNLVIGNPNAGASLANSGTVNINTAPITGGAPGSFNSDVLYTTGVTNLAVANNYLGVTWINNGAQVNANAAGALPSLVGDGGNAATRTALVMDANGAAPFTNVAAYPVPPVGATNSNAASTLNFGGNQAVQWLAGENNASAINLGAFNLTIGTNLGTPGFNAAIAGGALADNGSNTGPVFKGVINGTGQLFKDGNSRQTLTGNSTYTGFTTINGGVLQVGNANVAGDANLVSKLGPSLVFVNAGNLDINLTNTAVIGLVTDANTFNNTVFTVVGTAVRGISQAGITNIIAGPILGTGGYTQLGAGTTILTNTNLYTGPTNINAGTLQVGNGVGGSIAAGSTVNLANAATLNINLGANGTFGSTVNIANAGIIIASSANVQTISGNLLQNGGTNGGTFTMNGTGRTILTGNNTYNGLTTVNTGILQIGDGTTLNTSIFASNGAGPVAVNGTATLAVNLPNGGAFNNNVNLNGAGAATLNTLVAAGATNTLGGNIVGGASTQLNQSGAGTVILTGNNAGFAGTTTIAAGTLQLGNGGAGGALGNGNIVNNGTLVLDGNQAAYGNLISGNGALVKQQAVATTLNGNNTYNGTPDSSIPISWSPTPWRI